MIPMTNTTAYLIAAAVVLCIGGMVGWMLRRCERKVDEAYQQGYDKGRRETWQSMLQSELVAYATPRLRTETVKAKIIFEQREIANMGEEEIIRLAGRMLRSKVLEGIFPYMQIHHWTDPQACGEIVEARIRVVKEEKG